MYSICFLAYKLQNSFYFSIIFSDFFNIVKYLFFHYYFDASTGLTFKSNFTSQDLVFPLKQILASRPIRGQTNEVNSVVSNKYKPH